ncbi:MAG: large conductance mechanosensitive channel protein MscL [Patescibacteria group bacterium]|nr:large conductance mechanosensitive channel protein MscL [Patescibacteria group bacterium]
MKGFWSEFRNFAVKGNALDLAIAVVVGNAFSAVINSLVGDIITPLLGLLTNNVDFKTLVFTLHDGLVMRYGNFIQTIINFFVISLAIFIVFRMISSARKRIFRQGEKAVPQEEKPAQERLLEEIRDLLRRRVGEPTETSALKTKEGR